MQLRSAVRRHRNRAEIVADSGLTAPAGEAVIDRFGRQKRGACEIAEMVGRRGYARRQRVRARQQDTGIAWIFGVKYDL